jgi:hypothetical protein
MFIHNIKSRVNDNKKLSPMTCYYIRRLLRQNFDKFQLIGAFDERIQADSLADLNALINSIYPEDTKVDIVTNKLEILVSYHQGLVTQAQRYGEELAAIEQAIFWLLGFKLEPTSSQDYSVAALAIA